MISPRGYPDRPLVGVGAVIVLDGRVVLVRRGHEPLAGRWSLPGGALDLGESLVDGVAREVLEETGLVVDVGPLVDVLEHIERDERGTVRFHYVLVDCLCRVRGGRLAPGSDASDTTLADPADLAPYDLTEKTFAVIAKAIGMLSPEP